MLVTRVINGKDLIFGLVFERNLHSKIERYLLIWFRDNIVSTGFKKMLTF